MTTIYSRHPFIVAAGIAAAILSLLGIACLAWAAFTSNLVTSVRANVSRARRITVTPHRYVFATDQYSGGREGYLELTGPFETNSPNLGDRLNAAFDVLSTRYLGSNRLHNNSLATVVCDLDDGTQYKFTAFAGDFVVVESLFGPFMLHLRNKKKLDNLFLESGEVIVRKPDEE